MKKIIAAMLVMMTMLVGFAAITASATPEADKWYVCKYVGPPGSGEVLQGGDNPIFVDSSAIDVDPVAVGATFGDAQTHSVVIAGPYAPPGADPEPTCPTDTPLPSTTSPPPCEENCEPPTTTTPPPTTPPPVTGGGTVACPGHVGLGPWYGDPQINITLTGGGTFVVSGGVQRFSGTTQFTRTLGCNETFKIGRYKVQRGHFLSVTQDGVLVVHVKPPRFN